MTDLPSQKLIDDARLAARCLVADAIFPEGVQILRECADRIEQLERKERGYDAKTNRD